MYAIIQDRGKQFKVEEGSQISVDLMNVAEGDTVVFDNVLLVADGDKTQVGTPNLDNVKVEAVCTTAVKKNKKVVALQVKRRQGFMCKTGHRTKTTQLQIKTISA